MILPGPKQHYPVDTVVLGFVVLSILHRLHFWHLLLAAGSLDLINRILLVRLQSINYLDMNNAIAEWNRYHDQPPHSHPLNMRQKAWDILCVQKTYDTFLDNVSDLTSRARFLAVATKESGTWLNALPISSLSLRMEDNVIRIAVGLRLSVPLYRSHRC